MTRSSFYNLMYRLEYIIRYSNVPRIHDESVAAHSFFVCAILMALHDDYVFNLGRALQLAISHDMPESQTLDIPHEVKKNFPAVRAALVDAEKQAAKNFPLSVQDALCEYSEKDSVEYMMVHLADNMQCHQYALNEVKLGNSGYMYEVIDASSKRVRAITEQVERHKRK